MEHFQHVRSTPYLLKAFGILYVLIQPGHKYSTPPPTLCHVTACVFHIRVLVTLLVLGDDSNLLRNIFNMLGPLHSSRRHCFFHTHILIQPGHKYSTPPPTLCHVTACVFHIRVLTLLVGDDSRGSSPKLPQKKIVFTPEHTSGWRGEVRRIQRQILAKIDFGPLAHRYFHFEYRLL